MQVVVVKVKLDFKVFLDYVKSNQIHAMKAHTSEK